MLTSRAQQLLRFESFLPKAVVFPAPVSSVLFVTRKKYGRDRTPAQAPAACWPAASQAAELSGSLRTGVCGDKLLWAPLSQSRMRLLSVLLYVLGAWLCDQGRQTREPPSQPSARCTCLGAPGGSHASPQGSAPQGPQPGKGLISTSVTGQCWEKLLSAAPAWGHKLVGLWLEVLVFRGRLETPRAPRHPDRLCCSWE